MGGVAEAPPSFLGRARLGQAWGTGLRHLDQVGGTKGTEDDSLP